MGKKLNSADPPRVSVVLIFFNSRRFLAEAIDSVLAQDFKSYELLLVDDGSKDGSTAIAKSFQRRFPQLVRYLDHPGHANRGMSATRNLGAAAGHSEFIAFLDFDDRWAPQKLGEQVAILELFPAVDLVCGKVRYWRSWEGGEDSLKPTGHVHGRPVRPPEALLSLYPLGTATAPCPSDLLLRRDTFNAVGGFEEAFTGAFEDQAFLTKVYLEGTVYFADELWLDYRLHDQSCMAEVRRAGLQELAKRRFLRWFEDYLSTTSRRNDLRIAWR